MASSVPEDDQASIIGTYDERRAVLQRLMRQVRTRCSFLPQFVTFVVLVLTCPMGHADEASQVKSKELDPYQIWSSLLANRQKLTSGECDVRVEVLLATESDVAEQFSGSTWNYHLVWDHEWFRIDLTETRPKNPEDANDYRTSFFEGTIRSIPQYNLPSVAAYEDVVKEFDLLRPRPHLKGRSWIDPRIAGVWPDSFSGISTLTFGKLSELPSHLKGMEASADVKDGKQLIRLKWIYKKNNAVREFLLDPSLHFVPREVSMTVMPPTGDTLRDTISCQWRTEVIPSESTVHDFVLPETITYQRYYGEKLVWHEKSVFSAPKQLNKPIDKTIFEWAALGLQPGRAIIQSAGPGEGEPVQWNGTSKEKWKPEPLTPVDLEAPQNPPINQSSRILFWANVAVALACSGYFLRKYLRKQYSRE